jgi:Mg2+ and Co2+ transporter CorA
LESDTEGNTPMNLEITDEEREFLGELFEEKQKHMIQEINHTDTIDFERLLRKKIDVLEGLMRKIGQNVR